MDTTIKGYIKHQTVGSTYILGAGADKDVLILVSNAVAAREQLIGLGWECESSTGGKYDSSKFYSLRQGNNNALLVSDEEYYNAFVQAAEVCKYLKLTDRNDRVAVHAIVRDGKTADDLTEGSWSQ